MSPPAAPLPWRWLGRVGYQPTVAAMEAIRARVVAGGEEELLLCEHEPVITLGRSANAEHVVDRPAADLAGVELCSSSRGGDVTYHGPGQLMVYPVVRLRHGLVAHLEAIATALAELCAEQGVAGAAWRRDPAGLWLGGRKLGACGLHVSRGVAIHGFALDVATPPTAWRWIIPCGLSGVELVSLATARGAPAPTPAELAPRAAALVAARLAASDSSRKMAPSLPHQPPSAASSSSTTPTMTRS